MFRVFGLKKVFTIHMNQSQESHLILTSTLWGKREGDDLILLSNKERPRKVQDESKKGHPPSSSV